MLPVVILLAIATAAGIWLWLNRERRDRLWRAAWLVPAIALVAIAALVATDLGLQKVVGYLLMPAGLCWLALIVITIALFTARRWWSGAALAIVVLLYTTSGNVWLGSYLLARLEAQVPPGPDQATMEPFQAVFVLGGGTELMPDRSPRLSESGDRVVVAARLHLAGKAPLLVTGGQSIDGWRDLGDEVRRIWRGLGVPDTAVIVEREPRITRDEIIRYHALATQRGWTRVGVISSAWHLPRVLDHCRRLGWTVTAIPSDGRGLQYGAEFRWFIPQARGFTAMETACWEMLGRLTGR